MAIIVEKLSSIDWKSTIVDACLRTFLLSLVLAVIALIGSLVYSQVTYGKVNEAYRQAQSANTSAQLKEQLGFVVAFLEDEGWIIDSDNMAQKYLHLKQIHTATQSLSSEGSTPEFVTLRATLGEQYRIDTMSHLWDHSLWGLALRLIGTMLVGSFAIGYILERYWKT